MTASLAGFIDSEDGDIYANYCAHYGLQPGHIFSDDVVGFQVDLAYMLRDGLKPKPMPTGDTYTADEIYTPEP